MRTLSDTVLFKMLNKSNDLTGQIMNINNPLNILPLDKIDMNIDIINRRFNYALKNKALQDLNDGYVIPVFNINNIELPNFIPAVGIIENGVAKSYINLTPMGRMDKKGNFDIDNRKLFAYLQTGTLLRELSVKHWGKVSMNSIVAKAGSMIYAKLFNKVLDKIYAINLNTLRSDSVNYVTAKFFLLYVLERPNTDMVSNIAYQACFNGTTRETIYDVDKVFSSDAYQSFDKFIQNLATLDGLAGLKMRTFTENWMKMYNYSTVLGLEYFPYFLHMIFSAMVNAHINSEYIIEPLVGRETSTLYSEIARIIR